MFIVVVPYIQQQQNNKPPIVENCKHQVEIESDHWECFTDSEYNQYEYQAQKNTEQSFNDMGSFIKKWWWAIGALTICLWVMAHYFFS